MKSITSRFAAMAAGLAKTSTLKRNFSWSVFGSGVWCLCNWLMFTVLTKMSTSEVVGLYAFGIALGSPIITFAQVNLRSIQATDHVQQYKFGDYMTLRLVCMALALTVLAIVCYVGGYTSETRLVAFWLGIGMVLDSISDTFYGLQQRHEQLSRMGISLAAKGVLSLFGLGIVFYATHSIVLAVAASALASAVVVAGYDLPASVRLIRSWNSLTSPKDIWKDEVSPESLSLRWDPPAIRALFWLAFPMGVTMLLVSLTMNISRYFIASYMGNASLGIFAALAYLVVAGKVVVSGLGQAAYATLGRYYASGDKAGFRALLLKLTLLCGTVSLAAPILASTIGQKLLLLLYKPEYARHLDVFIMILTAGALGYVVSIMGYGITAARYIKVQVPWFGFTAIVTYLASLWLVPKYGLMGAAEAMLIATLCQLLSGLFILRHLFQHFTAPNKSRLHAQVKTAHCGTSN